MADQVSYRTPFRATSTSVNADLKSTAKYSLPTFAFALRAFLLVSFISSQLVLCNVTVATISPFISESENKSINISEFALISSTTTSTTTSAYIKSGDNYVEDSSTVVDYSTTTTGQPNNSGPLITTGPSDVVKRQDGLGKEEESKVKRDADDSAEDNGEKGEDSEDERSAISANNSTTEKGVANSADQSTAEHSKKANSTSDGATAAKVDGGEEGGDDEEEEEGETGAAAERNSGNSSLHQEHSNNTSALSANNGSTSADGKVGGEEDEEDAKPRMIQLVRRPSHQHNSRENEAADEEEEEEEDDEDDEDDYEDETLANNVCTAQYFLDKIIPEDYPTEISKEVKHINETIERINRMYNFSNQIVTKLNPFFREMASRVTDFLYEAQLNPPCLGSLFRIIKNMNDRKPWALSFFDATGGLLTGGYRQGKFVSLGQFDQCIESSSELPEENVNNEPIRGQYCLIKPVIPLPTEYRYVHGEPVAQSNIASVNRFLNDEYIETYLGLYKFLKNTILRVGVCLPDKCDPVDVENAMNKFLVRKTGLSVRVGPNCVKATDAVVLNNFQIVTLFIFGALFILIVICSTFEMIYRMMVDSGRYYPSVPRCSIISTPYSFTSSSHQYPAKFLRSASTISTPYARQPLNIQIFTMFSIIRNTRVLFEIPAYRKLPLDTMRLLFIFFFFISNAYIYTIVFAPMVIKRFYVLGPMQLATEKKYFFIRMYYMLDCLIAYSGISVALAFKPSSFNYGKYILQNYLRYAVPILFSIGLIYVIPLLGSGPLWHLFDETITHNCKKNLWPTLFFYNNINENIEEICSLPTAFVSLIFQMLLIAPIFLIITSRLRPNAGTAFLICMLIIASIFNLIPRFLYGYKLPYEYQAMKSFTEMKASLMFYNFHPFVHISPFIFGLIAGHLITNRPVKRPAFICTIGIVSYIGFLMSFFYMENLDIKAPSLSTLEIVSMLTFGRIPMLTFFCWIIYSCICGCTVIANRFLSSVVWRPLAGLSYGFYITSIIVTAYRLFSIRQTTTLSPENMFRTIVSDAVVSFFLSYMIHVMVQQPMRNFRQILIHWKQLFEVNTPTTTTNLVTVCRTDIVFEDSTDGTFTKTNVAEEYGSQFESSEKESISLDLAQITTKEPPTDKTDSNNNI